MNRTRTIRNVLAIMAMMVIGSLAPAVAQAACRSCAGTRLCPEVDWGGSGCRITCSPWTEVCTCSTRLGPCEIKTLGLRPF
jgi:hypothetical protein